MPADVIDEGSKEGTTIATAKMPRNEINVE